jgi:hypothetical protein
VSKTLGGNCRLEILSGGFCTLLTSVSPQRIPSSNRKKLLRLNVRCGNKEEDVWVIFGELVFSRDVFAHYLLVLPIREPGQQILRRSHRLFYRRECVRSYRSGWKLIDGFSRRDILAILFASIARSENRSNKFEEPIEGTFRIDPIQEDYCDSGLLEGSFLHTIYQCCPSGDPKFKLQVQLAAERESFLCLCCYFQWLYRMNRNGGNLTVALEKRRGYSWSHM